MDVPYLLAYTRRNDKLPLPRAVRNPDPSSRSGPNEILDLAREQGNINMDNLLSNDYVLDRAFVLDVAYRTDQYV